MIYLEIVKDFFGIFDDWMLFCGMVIGYENIVEFVNVLCIEWVDFVEWLRVIE